MWAEAFARKRRETLRHRGHAEHEDALMGQTWSQYFVPAEGQDNVSNLSKMVESKSSSDLRSEDYHPGIDPASKGRPISGTDEGVSQKVEPMKVKTGGLQEVSLQDWLNGTDAIELDSSSSSSKSWEHLFLGSTEEEEKRSEVETVAFATSYESSTEPLAQPEFSGDDPVPGSIPLELYNGFLDSIWTRLLLRAPHPPRSVMIFGATRGEGATFTSFHLSLFLACIHQKKVLYVDLDFEKQQSSPLIPDDGTRPGLVSFFLDRLPVESLIWKTQYPNLLVLPAGPKRMKGRASFVLDDEGLLSELADYCRSNFDVTIFDGQPALEFPSTIAFARFADQSVMVCRYGYSRREVSKLAIKRMQEAGVNVAGVILNDREFVIPTSIYKRLK